MITEIVVRKWGVRHEKLFVLMCVKYQCLDLQALTDLLFYA